MPSPVLFFIFIIVIDLILKSAKDKKSIEQAKGKRTQEIQNQTAKPKPMMDLRKILEEEVEKERQREMARRQGKTILSQVTKPKAKEIKEIKETRYADERMSESQLERDKISWNIRDDKKYITEKPQPMKPQLMTSQVEMNKKDLRQDILRGIIFSEILSEPKSIQNQRRSS